MLLTHQLSNLKLTPSTIDQDDTSTLKLISTTPQPSREFFNFFKEVQKFHNHKMSKILAGQGCLERADNRAIRKIISISFKDLKHLHATINNFTILSQSFLCFSLLLLKLSLKS